MLPPAADAGPDLSVSDLSVSGEDVGPQSAAASEQAPARADAAAATVVAPAMPDAPVATHAPVPSIDDAIRPPAGTAPRIGGGLLWLVLWVLSVALIAVALFAAWHGRVAVEHRWPESLWLFRLLPGGVPV